MSEKRNLLKTLWEKEKMLGTSIFSFSRNVFLPSQSKFQDSSKLKEFADDNFKFDENGRKLSKWVENTLGKREIARYEHTVSSRDLHYRHVKTKACLGKC